MLTHLILVVFVVFVQYRTYHICCTSPCLPHTFFCTLHCRHISHQFLMHGCSCKVDPQRLRIAMTVSSRLEANKSMIPEISPLHNTGEGAKGLSLAFSFVSSYGSPLEQFHSPSPIIVPTSLSHQGWKHPTRLGFGGGVLTRYR